MSIPPHPLPPQHVLVGVDTSHQAHEALRWACHLLKHRLPATTLHLVAVAEPVPTPFPLPLPLLMGGVPVDAMRPFATSHAAKNLSAAASAASAASAPWPPEETLLRAAHHVVLRAAADAVTLLRDDHPRIVKQAVPSQGSVAVAGAERVSGALLRYVQEHEIGLVVVGSRGLGSVQRGVQALMGTGSTSLALARHAEVPVVIVRSLRG